MWYFWPCGCLLKRPAHLLLWRWYLSRSISVASTSACFRVTSARSSFSAMSSNMLWWAAWKRVDLGCCATVGLDVLFGKFRWVKCVLWLTPTWLTLPRLELWSHLEKQIGSLVVFTVNFTTIRWPIQKWMAIKTSCEPNLTLSISPRMAASGSDSSQLYLWVFPRHQTAVIHNTRVGLFKQEFAWVLR